MNALETHQKRLHDELSAVEQEIRSHTEQIESLNQRLEGLKRAIELFEAEQPAIAELLGTGGTDGGNQHRTGGGQSWSTSSKPASRKATPIAKRSVPAMTRQRSRMGAAGTRSAKRSGESSGGLKRVDMLAAYLARHPGVTVRELIAGLDREFGWKPTESGITAHLYTNPKFVHTKPDRASNRPVTWSMKRSAS
jgi:hypothetical protein